MEAILTETKAKMEKGLQALKQELSIIRTGQASLAILDDVRVEYYGSLVPLNQVATLKIPEPKMITIQPWETKIIPDIEKAVMKAGLGLTPSNDGKLVRLPIPSLNEERRKDLVKLVKKQAEENRVAIRMIRREANEHLKKQQEAREISEDDNKKLQTQIQKLTDDCMTSIDHIVAAKEKDILAV